MGFMKKIPTRIYVGTLVLLLLAGCMFSAGTTYSWFAFATSKDAQLTSGKVSYRPNAGGNVQGDNVNYGDFIAPIDDKGEAVFISPGKELIKNQTSGNDVSAALKLKNLSTITTNLRVRVSAEIKTEGQTSSFLSYIGKAAGTEVEQMGLKTIVAGEQKQIPLFGIVFYKDSSASGYSWEQANVPVSSNCVEWELVPHGQTAATAAIKVPGNNANGDIYNTILSMKITSQFANVDSAVEKQMEEAFYKLYARKKLAVKVEYLAKQHDSMDWSVFHEDTFKINE